MTVLFYTNNPRDYEVVPAHCILCAAHFCALRTLSYFPNPKTFCSSFDP